jgi:hypothetical protein
VFFVVGGTMTFFLDGEWMDAPAGSFVLVPGNTPHDFENRGDVPAGALNVSAPGDFEDRMPAIADWFREAGGRRRGLLNGAGSPTAALRYGAGMAGRLPGGTPGAATGGRSGRGS